MKNRKSITRNALFTSIISLLLCVSMLVGTTFAWFTDEVVSGTNVIAAGNLDVDVLVNGESIQDKAVLFDEITLWEPGVVAYENLTVTNLGSLALKYQMSVNFDNATENDNGDTLAKVLKVGVVDDGVKSTAREDVLEEVTAWQSLETFVKSGKLDAAVKDLTDAQTSDTYGIVIYWEPSDIDNEFNMNNGNQGKTMKIDLGINLVATQLEAEEDSFGNDYDAEAEYPIFPEPVKVYSTTSFEEFKALMEGAGNIYIAENITVANPESSRFTEFELSGNVGIYAAEGATLTFAETTELLGDGTLTVYGGCIEEEQELCVSGNATLVFEDGEHSFAAFSATGNGKIVVNGGTLNCNGTYAGILGISFAENGRLIVNGGKLNMYQPFNLNANRCDAAYIEINDGTVELLNGIENLFVVRNVMDKDREVDGVIRGSSIRVNGGTFIAHYEIDSAGDATSFIRNSDSPSDTNKVLVSDAADGYDCVVTGGTFYGSWQRADNQRYTNGNGGNSDGLFVENSIAGFVADGYQITGDATNGYVVSAK